jgi:hypothetical protein
MSSVKNTSKEKKKFDAPLFRSFGTTRIRGVGSYRSSRGRRISSTSLWLPLPSALSSPPQPSMPRRLRTVAMGWSWPMGASGVANCPVRARAS